MNTLGIDAGTTRFKTAILNTSGEPQSLTNRMGEIFTPSVVCFGEDGSILVGVEAVHRGHVLAQARVGGHVLGERSVEVGEAVQP